MFLYPLAYAVKVEAVSALSAADLAIRLIVQLALYARILQIFFARAADSVVFQNLVPVDGLLLCNRDLHL